MRYVLLASVIQFIMVLCISAIAVKAMVKAVGYQALERKEREALESYVRTVAGKVDSAYVCKEKLR